MVRRECDCVGWHWKFGVEWFLVLRSSERGFVIRSGFLLVTLVLSLLAACSVAEVAREQKPEDDVAVRVKSRWAYLIEGNFEKSYELESPAYRKSVSLQQYRSGFKPGIWRGAEIESVKCEEIDICRVNVSLQFEYVARVAGPFSGKSIVREVWRKDEGGWWHVPDMR